jgi:hypothetical protein
LKDGIHDMKIYCVHRYYNILHELFQVSGMPNARKALHESHATIQLETLSMGILSSNLGRGKCKHVSDQAISKTFMGKLCLRRPRKLGMAVDLCLGDLSIVDYNIEVSDA